MLSPTPVGSKDSNGTNTRPVKDTNGTDTRCIENIDENYKKSDSSPNPDLRTYSQENLKESESVSRPGSRQESNRIQQIPAVQEEDTSWGSSQSPWRIPESKPHQHNPYPLHPIHPSLYPHPHNSLQLSNNIHLSNRSRVPPHNRPLTPWYDGGQPNPLAAAVAAAAAAAAGGNGLPQQLARDINRSPLLDQPAGASLSGSSVPGGSLPGGSGLSPWYPFNLAHHIHQYSRDLIFNNLPGGGPGPGPGTAASNLATARLQSLSPLKGGDGLRSHSPGPHLTATLPSQVHGKRRPSSSCSGRDSAGGGISPAFVAGLGPGQFIPGMTASFLPPPMLEQFHRGSHGAPPSSSSSPSPQQTTTKHSNNNNNNNNEVADVRESRKRRRSGSPGGTHFDTPGSKPGSTSVTAPASTKENCDQPASKDLESSSSSSKRNTTNSPSIRSLKSRILSRSPGHTWTQDPPGHLSRSPAHVSQALADLESSGRTSATTILATGSKSGGGHRPAHFTQGSLIQLADGSLKKVEHLVTEDFLRSADSSPEVRIENSSVVRLEQSQTDSPTVLITFNVGCQSGRIVQVTVEAAIEHPFYVFDRGWASFSPELTLSKYSLQCSLLKVGDMCISLTHKVGSSPANTGLDPGGVPTPSSSRQYLQPPLSMPSLMPVPSSPLFGKSSKSSGSPGSVPTSFESRLSTVSARPSIDIELATSFSSSARTTPTSALAKDSKSSPKQVGFNDIPSVYRINTDSPPNQRDPSIPSASEIRSSSKIPGTASKLIYQAEAKSRNSPILSKVKAPRSSPSTSTAVSTNILTAVMSRGAGGSVQGITTNNNHSSASPVKPSGAQYSNSSLTLVSHNDIDHKGDLGEDQKVNPKEDLDSSLKSPMLKRTHKVKINSSD